MTYRTTWETAIGQDCINLDASLAKWLGERLLFVSANGNTHPSAAEYYPNALALELHESHWKALLKRHGEALSEYAEGGSTSATTEVVEAAKEAIHFVADHLTVLWD